jgi:hypothetical protein
MYDFTLLTNVIQRIGFSKKTSFFLRFYIEISTKDPDAVIFIPTGGLVNGLKFRKRVFGADAY